MKKNNPFWSISSCNAPEVFESFANTPARKKNFKAIKMLTQAEYNNSCPKCSSEQIKDVEFMESSVITVECESCHHQWFELDPLS